MLLNSLFNRHRRAKSKLGQYTENRDPINREPEDQKMYKNRTENVKNTRQKKIKHTVLNLLNVFKFNPQSKSGLKGVTGTVA